HCSRFSFSGKYSALPCSSHSRILVLTFCRPLTCWASSDDDTCSNGVFFKAMLLAFSFSCSRIKDWTFDDKMFLFITADYSCLSKNLQVYLSLYTRIISLFTNMMSIFYCLK